MLYWFARKLKEAEEDERGFSLIELLVVVIIIGILAAIAIPTYLSQRDKAYNASAQSTLRNAATAQESYFTRANTYTTDKTELKGEGFKESSDAPLTIVGADKNSYCMQSSGGADTYYLDSGTGQIGTTSCSGNGTP